MANNLNTMQSSDPAMSINAVKRRRSRRNGRPDHPMARIIKVVNMPREYVNHTYFDFSSVPQDAGVEDPLVSIISDSSNSATPSNLEELTFPQKLFHVLANQDKYEKFIHWLPHGRSFIVKVPVAFEQNVLPVYFGHKRYSTFLRHLNNYGFKHITKGNDRNSYYHDCFLRGMPHLCRYMPEPRDARRKIPDPENEPDFYKISKSYPLPGAQLESALASLITISASLRQTASPASPPTLLAPAFGSVKRQRDASMINPPHAKRFAAGEGLIVSSSGTSNLPQPRPNSLPPSQLGNQFDSFNRICSGVLNNQTTACGTCIPAQDANPCVANANSNIHEFNTLAASAALLRASTIQNEPRSPYPFSSFSAPSFPFSARQQESPVVSAMTRSEIATQFQQQYFRPDNSNLFGTVNSTPQGQTNAAATDSLNTSTAALAAFLFQYANENQTGGTDASLCSTNPASTCPNNFNFGASTAQWQ